MKLPAERSESTFEDHKPAYTAAQALAEANRCLYCADAPCIKACPTEINIPEFIRRISTHNVRGSAKTIFEANILGMSCARVCPVEVLCVGDCVYNHLGMAPIQIGKLQRFATDEAFANGWRYFEAGPATGKSVGLVGGGPASLACAHELRRQGHAVTIYEKNGYLGGLNTNGVAPYKMRADRALTEVEWILAIGGVEVKTGVTVGKDVSLAELEEKHDALFVGIGLGPDSRLGIPGENLAGVYGAVDYIDHMKIGNVDVRQVQRAVVVGGGNTAIDAVRELSGLGVPEVSLVYRGDEPGMSGYVHEWEGAKIAGVRAAFQTQPVAFLGEGNKLTGVRCVKTGPDKKPIPGSEHELPCELALLAIGQSKLGELLSGLAGVVTERGRVVTDADGRTGRPKIFAGGDCQNGGKEVVNAAAEGKRAARAINAFLAGQKVQTPAELAHA